MSLMLRLAMGGAFLAAGWDKAFHPRAFAAALAAYQLVPERLVTLIATVLPFVELVCGAALVIGALTESAALVLGVLSTVFALAVGTAAARGLDIACGCFSASRGGAVDWPHVALDLVLVACAGALLRLGPGSLAVDNWLLVGKAGQGICPKESE